MAEKAPTRSDQLSNRPHAGHYIHNLYQWCKGVQSLVQSDRMIGSELTVVSRHPLAPWRAGQTLGRHEEPCPGVCPRKSWPRSCPPHSLPHSPWLPTLRVKFKTLNQLGIKSKHPSTLLRPAPSAPLEPSPRRPHAPPALYPMLSRSTAAPSTAPPARAPDRPPPPSGITTGASYGPL